jgi:hypothetical protein
MAGEGTGFAARTHSNQLNASGFAARHSRKWTEEYKTIVPNWRQLRMIECRRDIDSIDNERTTRAHATTQK